MKLELDVFFVVYRNLFRIFGKLRTLSHEPN